MADLPDFEKLGVFYMGREVEPDSGKATERTVLYDAKDLTTHAVCVGMTGSGKTGLCIGLLEEAAIDNIPAIAIDPKGDLANLMLTFPKLRAQDFRPWIDESAATRKGMTAADFAADRASLWKKGLAGWGQDGDRIERLRAAADVSVYTPGSSAGLPLALLRSFRAPAKGGGGAEEQETRRTEISAAVSALLALVGIESDALTGREHVLLANIIGAAWDTGHDLDLTALIGQVQNPPMTKIGAMDVDTFFPPKDRVALAMKINALLASPQLSAWAHGDPLDAKKLLYTDEGKPRVSIISVAHLSDSERMFVVTQVLNEVLAWMRTQPGTGSLRAILYMDEIFGFFPPIANPPSKPPMLTLLKQARAYGVGIVLATQNPADLDYKGLSNTGTWFVGRLQTERDKARLLDGLEGAAAASGSAFERKKMDAMISGLDSRVFLLHNVHEDAPVLMTTRWVMSYLAGPMTLDQVRVLMAGQRAAWDAKQAQGANVARKPGAHVKKASSTPPAVAPGVTQRFACCDDDEDLTYRPALLGTASLHFVRASAGLDEWRDITVLGEVDGDDAWERGDIVIDEPDTDDAPADGARFAELPGEAMSEKTWAAFARDLKDHLYRTQEAHVFACKALKLKSEPGETEGDFRVRCREAQHEARDQALEKVKAKFAPKLRTMEDRILRAQQKVEREKAQLKKSGFDTVISLGSTILNTVLGRKKLSAGNIGRASTTMKGAGRTAKERGDVKHAEESLEDVQQDMERLDQEFHVELEKVREAMGEDDIDITTTVVRPRKSDIEIKDVALLWMAR
ncbi:MAG: hypothetical protein KDA20_10900 [Phycisphaerales bacterium]|nr:hypothetical protein [Phycisphaerales bacterium]